jgi:DNA-binding transcriptional LysR family regulator
MSPLLDLEVLRTFTMIVKTGELKKAAENIHRSHAAVSMQMKRLEEQLGCCLMTRSNKGIRLTSAGKTLLNYSEQLLQLNKNTVSALSTNKFNATINFGIPTDYAQNFLSYFMPLLTEELPNLDANIHCDRSRNLRKQLTAGELDIAIVTGEGDRSNELLLWSERLVWSAPLHGQLEQQKILPIAMLTDNCIVRDLCLDGLIHSKTPYREVFSSHVLENVATAVHSGFAISLLPESLINENRSKAINLGNLPNDLTFTIHMIHSKALDSFLLERISHCMRQASIQQQQARYNLNI